MERESFESEEVAEILNTRFVSIKVDREERPDVDKVYVSSVGGLKNACDKALLAYVWLDY